MKFSRQTHLGSTATKLLTIVDLHGLPVWPCTIVQPKEAYILHQLPDELLVLVIKWSCYDNAPSEYHPCARFEGVTAYDDDCVMALSRVCHRFKRISQPLLFSAIYFKYPDEIVPPSIPVLKLHRTLICVNTVGQ
jgi:hypothetical protein